MEAMMVNGPRVTQCLPAWEGDLPLPEWVCRALFILNEQDGCTCTFEDVELWDQGRGHPTESCPGHTDCGGWTCSPPCGGCDRCIADQIVYYNNKTVQAIPDGERAAIHAALQEGDSLEKIIRDTLIDPARVEAYRWQWICRGKPELVIA